LVRAVQSGHTAPDNIIQATPSGGYFVGFPAAKSGPHVGYGRLLAAQPVRRIETRILVVFV